mmetsp:Transcript_11346/g.28702  ORF Transcript_11346/g.28702 Transcript_11346/m.28702 type:complete len:83 (-) Transcript_11346:461-709(-)
MDRRSTERSNMPGTGLGLRAPGPGVAGAGGGLAGALGTRGTQEAEADWSGVRGTKELGWLALLGTNRLYDGLGLRGMRAGGT